MASPTDLETYQIGRGTVVIEALFGSGLLPTAKPKILARRNTRGPDPLDLKQRSWPGWHPATCVFVFGGSNPRYCAWTKPASCVEKEYTINPL